VKTASVVVIALFLAVSSALASPANCNSLTVAQLVSFSSTGQTSGADNGCTITYNNVVYKFDYFTFSDSSADAIGAGNVRLAATTNEVNNTATFAFTYNNQAAGGNFSTFNAASQSVLPGGLQSIDFNLSFQLVDLGYTPGQSIAGVDIAASSGGINGTGGFRMDRSVGAPVNTTVGIQWGVAMSQTGAFGTAASQFSLNNHFVLSQYDGNSHAIISSFSNTFVFQDDSIFNGPPPTGVPEPSTVGLMGLALAGLAYWRRKFVR
jgi:hypothetical protein